MRRLSILILLLTPLIANAQPYAVGGDVKAPVVLVHIDPVYPEEARQERVSGTVIVETVIDHTGAVRDIKVLKGLPHGLSEAAVDAVKRWVFKPGTINGEAVDVLFNLTINFRLEKKDSGDAPLRVGGDVRAPIVTERVEPSYTEEARKARINGIVILEVVIGRDGLVKEVSVLKPLPFGLDQAAVDAVKQWRFKPGTLDGKPVDVIFNLTVNFRLEKAKDPDQPDSH
jgi:TonB family protein